MRCASTWILKQEKYSWQSRQVMNNQNNSHLICALIGPFLKKIYTRKVHPTLSKTYWKVIMVPFSHMGKQVQERPIPWRVWKMIQSKKVSCLDLLKMSSSELREILNKHSFSSGQVISKFTMKKLEICYQKIPKINLIYMKSQIQVFMSGTYPILLWKVCLKSMMYSKLVWKIDQLVQQTWMPFQVDHTLFFKLPLNDRKLALMASSILGRVSSTWWIWLVVKELPKQEPLVIDWKKQQKSICLFQHYVMLFQLWQTRNQLMYPIEILSLQDFCKIP